MEREVRLRRSRGHIAVVQAWRLALVLLIGLAMGVLSFLLNLAASALTLLRFNLATSLISSTGARPGASHALLDHAHPLPELCHGRPQPTLAMRLSLRPGTFVVPFFAFVGLAAAYGTVAGAVVVFFAPQAAGSGLAEMRCGPAPLCMRAAPAPAPHGRRHPGPLCRAYFNGVHVSGLLSLKTAVVKLVSAVFVLAAGLVAEGAALVLLARRRCAALRPPGARLRDQRLACVLRGPARPTSRMALCSRSPQPVGPAPFASQHAAVLPPPLS